MNSRLMSHFERNLDILVKNRIIYRRDPIIDKPTETFDWGWFFEDGTYECYTLFRSKAKITTYKSFKWHLHVLWYLNPQLDSEGFKWLADVLANKSNGFITFTVPPQILDNIVYEVSLTDLDYPPTNKLRKVIFKDFTGLNMSEKLSIVGKLIGRKSISETEIYEAMLLMHDANRKITITELAKLLNCSTRTIYRHMGNQLKKEKQLLNQQLC